MKPHFLHTPLLLAVTVFFLHCPAALAAPREKEPEIQHIVVTSAEGVLLLSASVQRAFPRTLLDELRGGTELNFVFSVELVRRGGGWFNGGSLARTTCTHTLRYDREGNEYVFVSSENRENPSRTTSLAEAEQWMSTFSQMRVAELSSLEADALYAIHMQAVLKQGMLPFNLGRFVPIWQVSGIQTDRRTIEFRY